MKYSDELKIFEIPYLYPWQELVIEKIRESVNTKANRIVILPTGAGKSLCFTLPALLMDGLTIIVYPLLALMNDQKRRLDRQGIPNCVLRGGQTKKQRQEIADSCVNGKVKIVITNPETLLVPKILEMVKGWKIGHLVVDEAHCIEEWGLTFRPKYLEWTGLIQGLNSIPITAFTATASPSTIDVIKKYLFLGQDLEVIQAIPDRPNIYYTVSTGINVSLDLLPWIMNLERPLVIFCRDRIKTRKLALRICEELSTEEVKFYHAGLSREERENVEKWFYDSTNGILTATNGYGMGVDKKNIRSVIHWGTPPTVQAYLQESGRGGRDGLGCVAVLCHNPVDGKISETIKNYIEESQCRRKNLMNALGHHLEYCHGCDLCQPRIGVKLLNWNNLETIFKSIHHRIDRKTLLRLLWGRPVPYLKELGWRSDHPAWGFMKNSRYEDIDDFLNYLEKSAHIQFPNKGFYKGLAECQFLEPIPSLHTENCD